MRRRWKVVGALALVLGLWVSARPIARRMDFFRVRRVEFAGLRYQSVDTALTVLALPSSLNLFADLGAVERRARSIPGVVEASVSRRPPGTLVVTLRERTPVALVAGASGMQLMDARGRLLPFDPVRSAPDLPVADTNAAPIGRLLARVRRADPELFSSINGAGLYGLHDVALLISGRRYILRPDASHEEMRAVTLVAQDLARKGRAFTELDGRFDGYVVVRGAGS